MIGISSVGAEARRQQHGFNRLKPTTQRAFVLQFLSRFRILRRITTGAAPCLGVTPEHPH
jgi:hypothetical protein